MIRLTVEILATVLSDSIPLCFYHHYLPVARTMVIYHVCFGRLTQYSPLGAHQYSVLIPGSRTRLRETVSTSGTSQQARFKYSGEDHDRSLYIGVIEGMHANKACLPWMRFYASTATLNDSYGIEVQYTMRLGAFMELGLPTRLHRMRVSLMWVSNSEKPSSLQIIAVRMI